MEENNEWETALRPVFEAFDETNSGVISVIKFRQIAEQFLGASDESEVLSMVSLLDPDGKGNISFEAFVEGIQQVLEAKGINSVTDLLPKTPESNGLQEAETNLIDIENESSKYDDNDWDSAIGAPSLAETRSARSPTDLEDFGEGDFGSEQDLPEPGVPHTHSQLRGGQQHEDLMGDIDGNFDHFNEKLRQMQDALATLSAGQQRSDETHVMLRGENQRLQGKVTDLVNQLREVESSSQQKLDAEDMKIKEVLMRQDRDRLREIEQLQQRLADTEKQLYAAKEELPLLKAETNLLKEERFRWQSEEKELNQQLISLQRKLTEASQSEARLELECEQQRTQAERVIEELQQEADSLRARLQQEMTSRSNETNHSVVSSERCERLQQEVERLKQEKTQLIEAREELQARLLAMNLQEGKNILDRVDSLSPDEGAAGGASLADEFSDCSKDEIGDKLRIQQEQNIELRSYLDKLILNIMEVNPAMLEIPSSPRAPHKVLSKATPTKKSKAKK